MTKSTANRQRAGGKRSRTGCRTCRARHIKCDETARACTNCTSTGRSCDGYELYRLPANRNRQRTVTVPRALPPNSRRMTSDELRCFSYFQQYTAPYLEFVESMLWQRLVLQMSQAEPAVFHAIIALSAIHQAYEAKGMTPNTTVQTHTSRNVPWQQFALEQASQSFAHLSRRHAPRDPQLRETTLLCCLLFVLCDLLQGQYEHAFQHLHSGVSILQQPSDARFPSPPAVQESLVRAFEHLDIQCAHFRVRSPSLLCADEELQSLKHSIVFRSVHEAHQAFDQLLARLFCLANSSNSGADGQIAPGDYMFHQKRVHLWSQTEQVTRSFNAFRQQYYTDLSRQDQQAADLLYIHLFMLPRTPKGYLLNGRREPSVSTSRSLLFLTEAFLRKYPKRPSFLVNAGVIPPLLNVALYSPDYGLRWRAIEVLRSWSHREGPWDSVSAAQMAVDAMSTGSLAEDPGDIGPANHVSYFPAADK
ncbi:hypothetical protein BBP40_009148 [Aspergillus hancockii]|nr:hypothetical protein BBP40_009148 [Aspergillus hancockii]